MKRYEELCKISGTNPDKEELAEIIYVKELEIQTLYGVLDRLGVVIKESKESD